jgi:hypothetical protein
VVRRGGGEEGWRREVVRLSEGEGEVRERGLVEKGRPC